MHNSTIVYFFANSSHLLDQDWILGWTRIGSGLAKEWLRIGQGLVLDWPHVDADLVLLRAFRPPSRLGTNPHRGLVPRLSRQTSS